MFKSGCVKEKGMFVEQVAHFEHTFRRFVSLLPAEVQVRVYSAGRKWFLSRLASERPPKYEPTTDLERVLWGVKHQGPLMWAAGVDKAGELYHVSARQGAAAHMVGTTTANARAGNVEYIKHPFVPFPKSGNALNSLGLPNPGDEVVAGHVRKFYLDPTCPLWASVMASPDKKGEEQLEGLVKGMATYALSGVKVLELNESCPNTSHDHAELESRLRYVKENFIDRCSVPVVVKWTVDTPVVDVPRILNMLFDLGYAGVNFGNSSKDREWARAQLNAGEREVFDCFTGRFKFGFTGPALKEKSLALCARTSEYVKAGPPKQEFHVVRTGGIESGKDLRESDQAGVSINQWVTGYWKRFGEDGHRVYKEIHKEYRRAK